MTSPKTVETIRRSIVRLNRRLRSVGTDQTLSANKLSALGHLYTHPGATPGDLAAAERLQPQSLTRLLSELEKSKYILRERSADDRRQSCLKITDVGRKALLKDMSERDQWLRRAISQLSPTEQGVLEIAATIMDRMADLELLD